MGIADAAGQEKDWSLEFIDDIETAKKLLLFSQKPIAEVSRLSGFASPQYFSRFFKKRIGITAEEFRSRRS